MLREQKKRKYSHLDDKGDMSPILTNRKLEDRLSKAPPTLSDNYHEKVIEEFNSVGK